MGYLIACVVVPLLMYYVYRDIKALVVTTSSYRYFEYKTPHIRSKWEWRLDIGLSIFYSIPLIMVLFILDIASHPIMFLLVIVAIYILIRAIFSYDPMLRVIILEDTLFLRYRSGRFIWHEYIPLSQIKDIIDTFAEREFHSQYLRPQKGYYTFEFRDGTGWDGKDVHGVDLKLKNGKHFYVGFNGVEKFIKELKERIGMS